MALNAAFGGEEPVDSVDWQTRLGRALKKLAVVFDVPATTASAESRAAKAPPKNTRRKLAADERRRAADDHVGVPNIISSSPLFPVIRVLRRASIAKPRHVDRAMLDAAVKSLLVGGGTNSTTIASSRSSTPTLLRQKFSVALFREHPWLMEIIWNADDSTGAILKTPDETFSLPKVDRGKRFRREFPCAISLTMAQGGGFLVRSSL